MANFVDQFEKYHEFCWSIEKILRILSIYRKNTRNFDDLSQKKYYEFVNLSQNFVNLSVNDREFHRSEKYCKLHQYIWKKSCISLIYLRKILLSINLKTIAFSSNYLQQIVSFMDLSEKDCEFHQSILKWSWISSISENPIWRKENLMKTDLTSLFWF